MEIAKRIAGFTPAEADDLRKAVGKKKRDLMATMEGKFIDGCAASGTAPAVAKDLWSLMTAAADYSFNKSHAACYALISYRTAYLKANYPAEYMAAVISSVMSTKDKVPFFVNSCDEMGIERPAARRQLLRPRLRRLGQLDPVRARCGQERRPRRGRDDHRRRGRRTGRSSRSGTSASGSTRAPINKRAIECLIKCGALDSTGDDAPRHARGARARRSPRARRRRRTRAAARARSSTSAATPAGAEAPAAGGVRGAQRHPPMPADEFDQRELLRLEKETLGTFLSAHPLGEVRDALRARVERPLAAVGGHAGRRLGDGRRDRQRGEEGAHAKRRLRDVRRRSTTSRARSSCSSATPPCEAAEAIAVDRVVVVRGRVDHKGRGRDEPRGARGGAVRARRQDELAAARAKARRGRRARSS